MDENQKEIRFDQKVWIDLTLTLQQFRERHGLSDAELIDALSAWSAHQQIVGQAMADFPKTEPS